MATIFCSKCKTELPEGAVFCHICGSKLVYGAPKCPNCNREIVKKSRYCSFCGKEIRKDNSTAQVTDIAPKKLICLPENFSKKTQYTTSLIGKIATLLVSIVLVLLTFLPVRSSKSFYIDNTDDIHYYQNETLLYDNVIFALDSLESVPEDKNSHPLLIEYINLIEECYEAIHNNTSFDELKSNLIKQSYLGERRMNLVCPPNPVTIMRGAMSIIVIGASVALFVLALIDLIQFLLGKQNGKVTLATLILLSINAISIFAVTCFTSISLIALIGLLLSFAVLLYIAIIKQIVYNAAKIDKPNLLKRFLSIVVAAGLIICLSLPVFNLTFVASFPVEGSENRELSLYTNNCDVDSLEFLGNFSNNDAYDAESSMSQFANLITSYYLEEIYYQLINSSSANLACSAFIYQGGYNCLPLFTNVPLFAYLSMALAATTICYNLIALCTDKNKKEWLAVLLKCTSAVLAILTCILIVAFVLGINSIMGEVDLGVYFKTLVASITASPIIATVLSIALIIISPKKRNDSDYNYDEVISDEFALETIPSEEKTDEG